jgi:hypothetical protein
MGFCDMTDWVNQRGKKHTRTPERSSMVLIPLTDTRIKTLVDFTEATPLFCAADAFDC